MDDARRGAARVLAIMTETIREELQSLIDAEESAITGGHGDSDVLRKLESALDDLTDAIGDMEEAAKPYEPASPAPR
jgi:hypothetical protein